MTLWERIVKLFRTKLPASEELTKAEKHVAVTKGILDESIAKAEKIGKIVEIKAQRDVRKANQLVQSTNEAVRVLQRTGK